MRLNTKEKNNRIPLVTPFNNTLSPIAKIIRNRWDILKLNPNFDDTFKESGMVAYRRPANLREIIGSNKIAKHKVIRKNTRIKTIKFCQPCHTKNNLCCIYLKHTNSFYSSTTKNTYKIYHESNCKSNNVIYLLECTRCWKQYVGRSEWPFYFRLNNYRHRIKSTEYNKLLPVEQHFRLPNHDFNKDAKCTIIERIEKSQPYVITRTLETHEDNWILRLKTLAPHGLNNKLNHPDNINL